MKTQILYSGIMTTYACSAACAHCLYRSSPRAKSGFITSEKAEEICAQLGARRVRGMHIGGGEPFIDLKSLRATADAMRRHNISIDYIETNAFWFKDAESAMEIIRELGAPIMVSVDPFHAEFVAPEKPIGLIRALEDNSWPHFVWQEKFVRQIMPLVGSGRLSRDALKKALGENYLENAARSYGLSVNGRALEIARGIYESRGAANFLSDKGCRLLDGMHCHIDLYGNYIPPFCPGLAIDIRDLDDIDPKKYPVITQLVSGGVSSLWDYAREAGYVERASGYISQCDLCLDMRKYLLRAKPSADMGPECFYAE